MPFSGDVARAEAGASASAATAARTTLKCLAPIAPVVGRQAPILNGANAKVDDTVATMPHADVNGQRLYYEDTGAGEPVLVFSHGLFMDHSMFDPQVRA